MKSDYLTSKPAFYALFVFSVPIIIGNLFQQLYTMVDSAVVGRFVGEQALAAGGGVVFAFGCFYLRGDWRRCWFFSDCEQVFWRA